MKLQLQYNKSIHFPVSAAFIRGSVVYDWLKEINRWICTMEEIDCYILPESIQSIQPGGLFIIFKNQKRVEQIDLFEPYYCIENKLYIPIQTELTPQVSNNELRDMLLWEKQVFHPNIGLIGFEAKDRINLADLFVYGKSQTIDWSFAHPGLPDRPVFNQIVVKPPTVEELMEAMKQDIKQKPLKDIPKNEKEDISTIEKLTDKIKSGILKTGLLLIDSLNKILPESTNTNPSQQEGLFQKLQNWITQNLNDLEKKRKDEIKRLLDLFDENTDEALQFAIPLDSPYQNRGTETSSSLLTRNNLQFNLGRLGGGKIVDSWDIGDKYGDLRNKYLKAAQKEIEKKDFKKAAYVYAHLLGDYNNAADVLEQGNMHREAATLYKDHLKNLTGAANCLERGLLYAEAIEIYKELNQHEKIGDLYSKLDQPDNAEYYYEQFIAIKLQNSDYLDASRMIKEKLLQPERAKTVLLNGWNSSYQYESCLKKYFDVILETENAEKEIKEVFNNEIPDFKKTPFLNVLEHIHKNSSNNSTQHTITNIAYQVIHDEAEIGNERVLHYLKSFLPEDKLIGSDTSRYLNNIQKRSTKTKNSQVFHLDQSIKWTKAIWHRNQFLVLGIKNSYLHLARGNWYENIEYNSWGNTIKNYTYFTFISAPYYSDHIILHNSEGVTIAKKSLAKNKYFNNTLTIHCPVWLYKETAQLIINKDKSISKIEIKDKAISLHKYSIEGNLQSSVNCTLDPEITLSNHTSNPLLTQNNGYYFTYINHHFISINEEGKTKSIYLESIIRFFSASNFFTEFYIVISTNKGCFLCKPENENLNMMSNTFAETITPSCISFIADNKFILIQKRKAHLFEIIDMEPGLVNEYETHTSIIAALPSINRNEFALVEESGRITKFIY